MLSLSGNRYWLCFYYFCTYNYIHFLFYNNFYIFLKGEFNTSLVLVSKNTVYQYSNKSVNFLQLLP